VKPVDTIFDEVSACDKAALVKPFDLHADCRISVGGRGGGGGTGGRHGGGWPDFLLLFLSVLVHGVLDLNG
jgi:hypothetical protein